MIKPSRKLLLVIGIVAGVIIATALSVPSIIETFAKPGGTDLVAMARADKEIAYAGENVSFNSSGSIGDITNYTWNFSDGNSSSVPDPFHSYEIPGWYNVSLTVVGRSGGTSSCQLRIGIQHKNESDDFHGPREYDIRPNRGQGYSLELDVGPNIGNPTLAVNIDLVNGVGTFVLQIFVLIRNPDGTGRAETLYAEGITLMRENYHFNHTYQPDELPSNTSINSSEANADIFIDQGTWSEAMGSMSADFPITEIKAEQRK